MRSISPFNSVDSRGFMPAAGSSNRINAGVVESFKSAMKAAGKQLTVESYDADHAFANPSSARYNEKAAGDAWRKTIAFYKEHLDGG